MSALQHVPDVGLGLDYQHLRLQRTTKAWLEAGAALRDHVADVLQDHAAGVEQVGSAAVEDLLAKPIIDLAVGLADYQDLAFVQHRLEVDDWIYRGDAGPDGGHIFVLETRPWHRVAHLHVVGFGDEQWLNYLQLRDLLRRSPNAREQYEAVKLRLIADSDDDWDAYTIGKSEVVLALIGGG